MPLQGKGSKKETLTLTQARKADGKVRKLAEEEAQKRKQFAAYAAMMKQAFNQNQKQFAKDMARIAEERKVAETIGLNAARSVLQGRQSPMEVEAPTETSAWHALLTRAPEEEEPQDGYYAAAMLALQQAAASSAVASRPPAPPFTPPGRMLPLKPMTPMPTPRDFAAMAAAMYGSQAMADCSISSVSEYVLVFPCPARVGCSPCEDRCDATWGQRAYTPPRQVIPPPTHAFAEAATSAHPGTEGNDVQFWQTSKLAARLWDLLVCRRARD